MSDGPGRSPVVSQLLTLLAAVLGLVGGVFVGERSNETQRDVALLIERHRHLANVYADFVARYETVHQAYADLGDGEFLVVPEDVPSMRDALKSALAEAEHAAAKVQVFGTDEARAEADDAMRILRATGCGSVTICTTGPDGDQRIDRSLLRTGIDRFISVARRDLESD